MIVGAGPGGPVGGGVRRVGGARHAGRRQGGIGGQATSSSLIRNYLGFPRGVSGRRLAQQAYEQAWVFGASFAFMQRATDLRATATGSSVASPTAGGSVTRAVSSRRAPATAGSGCPRSRR